MNRRSFWSRIAAALGIAAAPRVLAESKPPRWPQVGPPAFACRLCGVIDFGGMPLLSGGVCCSKCQAIDCATGRAKWGEEFVCWECWRPPMLVHRTGQWVCEQCDGTFLSRGPASLCSECSANLVRDMAKAIEKLPRLDDPRYRLVLRDGQLTLVRDGMTYLGEVPRG